MPGEGIRVCGGTISNRSGAYIGFSQSVSQSVIRQAARGQERNGKPCHAKLGDSVQV